MTTKLLFQTQDPNNPNGSSFNWQLGTSDGTAGNGFVLAQITASNVQFGSDPHYFVQLGNKVLFQADDGTHGIELWATDGTTTQMIKDIWSGSNSGFSQETFPFTPGSQDILNINQPVVVGNEMYFQANDGNGPNEIWKSDGTTNGTMLVKSFNAENTSVGTLPQDFVNYNGEAYFVGNDAPGFVLHTSKSGPQVWKTDGTTTVAVTNIQPVASADGFTPAGPTGLTVSGGNLFFPWFNGDLTSTTGIQLYVVNNANPGGLQLTTTATTIPTSAGRMTAGANGELFFVMGDATNGTELWESNGTVAGTQIVKDIFTGSQNNSPNSSNPTDLTFFNGELYFFAQDGVHGVQLWKSDGSGNGTTRVTDVNDNGGGIGGGFLTPGGNVLYFIGFDGTANQLWKTDGTTTTEVTPGFSNGGHGLGDSATELTYINGTLYFGVNLSNGGSQLWKSDGTLNGTGEVTGLYNYRSGLSQISFITTAATPTLNTSQQPASAIVGSSIADKATVSGGANPTGTVTFQLFNNPNGNGPALFTDTEPLVNGIATSAGYTATAAGTDYWVATYNGDANNSSVTSGTASEPVSITKATPSINSTQQPASATIGSSIADKATVSGGFNLTGTVTFQLFNNPNGTGPALFTDTEPLVGGMATSASFTPAAIGTDYWVDTYNGDSNNNAVTSGTALEPVSITPVINPAPPAGTTADMITHQASTGNYEIYDLGNNSVLAADPLTNIAAPWHVVGLGGFNGSDTTDMMLRNTSTGAFEIVDVSNNNASAPFQLGAVGLQLGVAGFGDFSGHAGETDMMLRDSTNGNFVVYDISNNMVTSATSLGAVGLQEQVLGFGDFTGNANETDMLLRDSNTGSVTLYEISNNQVTSAMPVGTIGLNLQFAGVGDFSGHPGETDLMMRDSSTGNFVVYDFNPNPLFGLNGTITSTTSLGAVGLQLTVAGFGNLSGNANETDMMLRNSSTGEFLIYDISNNQVTAVHSIGAAGLTWTVDGIAKDPPTAGAPSSGATIAADEVQSPLASAANFDPVGATGWLTQAMQTGAGFDTSSEPVAGAMPATSLATPDPLQTHTA